MARVLLAFTMSLDGFIAGPDVSISQPLGAGGARLHEWLLNDDPDRVDAEMAKEQSAMVGAVILGRRTFDVGVKVWNDTPYPVPTFVLTHETRDDLVMSSAAFTFVTDGIESALRQAKAAAGEKDVMLMGANVAQQYLGAGLVDDMFLQLAPVLLGTGTRLFEQLGARELGMKCTRSATSPYVTHLHFQRSTPAGTSASPSR